MASALRPFSELFGLGSRFCGRSFTARVSLDFDVYWLTLSSRYKARTPPAIRNSTKHQTISLRFQGSYSSFVVLGWSKDRIRGIVERSAFFLPVSSITPTDRRRRLPFVSLMICPFICRCLSSMIDAGSSAALDCAMESLICWCAPRTGAT